MLKTGEEEGIIHSINNLNDEMESIQSVKQIPLFEGDYWAGKIADSIKVPLPHRSVTSALFPCALATTHS